MNFRSTSCCAWQEITGLSTHSTPKDAMITFCKANLTQGESRIMYHSSPANQNRLYSFYLFSAAVHTAKSGGSKFLQSVGEDYGSKFAKFILDNKLGTITESPVKPNMAFHEEHSNRIWIWATDQKAIETWWENEKKTNSSLKAEQEKEFSKLKNQPNPNANQIPQAPAVQQAAIYFIPPPKAQQAPAIIFKEDLNLFKEDTNDDDEYELPDWDDDEDDEDELYF